MTKVQPNSHALPELILRKALHDDCHDLWVWRNHLEARRWSFHKEIIPYEKHQEWFQQALNNGRTVLFIVEHKNGQKVGQVRFDLKEELRAWINISLNPEFFSQGFGSLAIQIATEALWELNPFVQEIVAEIFEDNVASLKSFEKAGYSLVRKTVKGSEKINIYHKKVME